MSSQQWSRLPQKASLSLHSPDLSLAMKTFRCHLGRPLVVGHSVLGIYVSVLRMNFAFLRDNCNATLSLPSKPQGIRKLHVGGRWGCCSDCPSPWSAGSLREKCLSYSVSLLLPPHPRKRGSAPPPSPEDSQILENEEEHLVTEREPSLVGLPTASAGAPSRSRDA